MGALAQYARRGIELGELPPLAGLVASFFRQFADGSLIGGFAGFEGAGGDLPKGFAGDRAAVAQQTEMLRINERKDGDGARMENHVALHHLAVGVNFRIKRELDLPALINHLPWHGILPLELGWAIARCWGR